MCSLNNSFHSKRRKTHRQSKYFTIMLIPDSSGKVRSIKIPHWVFHVTFSTIAAAVLAIVIVSSSANHFSNMFNETENELSAVIKEKEYIENEKVTLETNIEQEKMGLIETFEAQKEQLIDEKETVESKINTFEGKIEELQEKIDEIDAIKQEIYDKIGALEDIGAPVSVAEIETDSTNPVGGPHVAIPEDDAFMGVLIALEAKLDNDIKEMNALRSAADDVVPFLLAYPKGWPVYGRVTSEFGYRSNPFGGSAVEYHTGLDIKCSTGTEIASTADGVVTFSGYQNGYGNVVVIDHGYGFETFYAHNSELLVYAGESVTRGEIIAYAGSTGRSTGPHCHYEVRLDSVARNPRNYLE